jgi:hypothetical protein
MRQIQQVYVCLTVKCLLTNPYPTTQFKKLRKYLTKTKVKMF